MKLRTRFAVWIASLMLVALAAFGTFVYVSLTAWQAAAVDDALRLSASQLVATSDIDDGRLDISDNPVTLDSTLTDQLRSRGMTIQIFSPEGDLLQSIGPLSRLGAPATALQDPAGASSFATLTAPGAPSTRVRVYTQPIRTSNQLVGLVQVSQSLESADAVARALLTSLLIGLPVVAGASGLGGYLLAGRALAPIDKMTGTARRISAEGLSERLRLPRSNDELGRLAVTFDEMLDRLDDAFQHERRFTHDAAHELRTPLAAMQSIISVTGERRRTPEEYEAALGDLAEETDRLRTLTEALLRLGRAESSPAATDEVPLSVLLPFVADTMRAAAEAKGLDLTCEVDPELQVTGDTDAMIRVFLNMVDNAIKYTAKGRVAIRGRVLDRTSRITITDTGQGISAEHLPHVFERFYRADEGRSTPGSGLGLAICDEIVRAHNGTISAESSEGTGTTITVTFPRLETPDPNPTRA